MALIQGPPGTGKTYVGIQLVKTLIANTQGNPRVGSHRNLDAYGLPPRGIPDVGDEAAGSSLSAPAVGPCVGPILIVCFTNHALDQFLEELLAAGLTDIVRVGGRSDPQLSAVGSSLCVAAHIQLELQHCSPCFTSQYTASVAFNPQLLHPCICHPRRMSAAPVEFGQSVPPWHP